MKKRGGLKKGISSKPGLRKPLTPTGTKHKWYTYIVKIYCANSDQVMTCAPGMKQPL